MTHVNQVPRAGRSFINLNYLDIGTHKSSQNRKVFVFAIQVETVVHFLKSHAKLANLFQKQLFWTSFSIASGKDTVIETNKSF